MRLPSIHRRGAPALADLGQIERPAGRTSLLRVALALALAGTLAVAVLDARSAGAGRAAVLPEGASTGVIVLDMSASISGPIYARVATTLKGIVAANQGIGLVMFSDTAYELLPPNSPPTALSQFIPFFVPTTYSHGNPIFAQSPWSQFSGGTRMSSGLVTAQRALRAAGVTHGSILIISDLDDSAGDQPVLVNEAFALKRAHIPVRIVPLFADPSNKRFFAALFGKGAFVSPSAFRHTAKQRQESIAATEPWALLALGLLLVLLLAGNERLNGRLTIGAPS
ncbi:MAG TPA: vWA domain-containing protein [Gaiellaceae bacterium]|nr:vWA domain-containing protein [Gaiellaceae bacterium]